MVVVSMEYGGDGYDDGDGDADGDDGGSDTHIDYGDSGGDFDPGDDEHGMVGHHGGGQYHYYGDDDGDDDGDGEDDDDDDGDYHDDDGDDDDDGDCVGHVGNNDDDGSDDGRHGRSAVTTACDDKHPKGVDALRIVGEAELAWRNPPPDGESVIAQVAEELRAAESLPEAERKRAVKRLLLEWHPDKNAHRLALSTMVFQYLQAHKGGVISR